MTTTRRGFLCAGAVLSAGLLTGCQSIEQRLTRQNLPPDALPPPTAASLPAMRLLNRAAYGPRPGDIALVTKLGIPAWVDAQLQPETLAEDAGFAWRLRSQGDALNPDTGTLFDEDDRRLVAALRQATLLRAVYSRRQLEQRMVEFWTDHFNIYAFKGQGPQLKVVDDAQAIRPHALGRFRDLLKASAHSAAMLGYLDNTANRRGLPNENYARELMELHTLGVDGGYTQRDVHEAARCLSGWTSEAHWHRGRFRFEAAAHDDGRKQVLGTAFPAGGGQKDGERLLDLLAAHPATARHLAVKLCRHFLGDAPQVWVSHLAAIYLTTNGDIKAMLRPLLLSDDLLHAAPLFKRPYDYAVSALRALGADTDGGAGIQQHLEAMGQPSFGWPMPDGYPEKQPSWTGAMVPRWNFALALAGGTIDSTALDMPALRAAARHAGLSPHDAVLHLAFGPSAAGMGVTDLRGRTSDYPDVSEYCALVLASPAFAWR